MLGWAGPWQDAVDHALNGFTSRFRRPDGLFRTQVAETGEALDETAMVYDQAFALLALATAFKADRSRRGLVGLAAQTREALEGLRHPAGGFREAIAWPYQANCHMHLLEAALAWIELGEPGWDALADELVALALTRFIDAEAGFLREFFSEDWTPADGVDGRIVEPGHQFEWAWLLERWGILRNREDARAAARALFEHGIRGVDPVRGVAVNALWDDGSIKDGQARLWPQTEYIKAALILDRPDHALAGLNGLRPYLETPAPGTWFDKLQSNGSFIDEPAPASSFYPIMVALEVLRASTFF
jgi:mannose-6-phosphate isomerase